MFVSDYMKNCSLCGRPVVNEYHHLVYGVSNRKLSDEDGLVIPVCRGCHDEIHKHGAAGKMSKIMGQLIWEINTVSNKKDILKAREAFVKRYGRSYL